MPGRRVRAPPSHASETAAPATAARITDRLMARRRGRTRRSRRWRRGVPRHAGRPEEQPEPEHAAGEQDDVLARDRQEVVEARPSEARLQRGREPVVITEEHSFEDGAPFSRKTGRGGAAEPAPEAVGGPAEPAPAPDEAPVVEPSGRRECPDGAGTPRSSKPFDGPRGKRTTARRLTREPWGGARPRGSSSWTRSSILRPVEAPHARG